MRIPANTRGARAQTCCAGTHAGVPEPAPRAAQFANLLPRAATRTTVSAPHARVRAPRVLRNGKDLWLRYERTK